MPTLADILPGTIVRIVSIEEHKLTQRLMEMNIIPGNFCKVLFIAPAGDPIAVEIAGDYTLALRRKEAGLIRVEH